LLEGVFFVPLVRVKRSINVFFAITVVFLFFTLAGYLVIVI
jgi:hypothetical protein